MRRRRCSRHQGTDSPPACGKNHCDTGFPSAAHGVPHQSRYLSCSLWRTSPQSRWMCLEGSCSPQRAHPRVSFLAGLVARKPTVPYGDLCWSSPLLKDSSHGKGPCWSSFWRVSACGMDWQQRSSWSTVSHGSDPILDQGKSVSRKKEGKDKVLWIDFNSPSPSTCTAWGEEAGESGV